MSSKDKWTSGPWRIGKQGMGQITFSAEGKTVGKVYCTPPFGDRYGDISRNVPVEEAKANIKLIVSVHYLLAACKGLLQFIKTFDMGGDWCQRNYPAIKAANAAIAQAEGNDSVDGIPDEPHKRLLEESLEEHADIWKELAQK